MSGTHEYFKLSEVTEMITDGSHNPPKGVERSDYLMLSSRNVLNDKIDLEKVRYLSKKEFEQENRRTCLQDSDVLLTIVGTIGRAAVFEADLGMITLQRSVAVIRPTKSKLNSRFLMYSLQSKLATFLSESRGVAQQGFYLDQLRNLYLLVPSLEQQREIVEKLDSAFTEIDSLEEIHSKKNEDSLARLFDTYRDSLLSSACAGNPATEFGEIGTFVRGPFGGSLKKSIFKKTGIAVYEQQHAIHNTFENFRYFVDEKKYQEMKRFEVHANDLIMSCSGTYGKIAVVPEGSAKGIINQALLKITPEKGVKSQFIKHWMQSGLFQLELEKEVGGAALQNVPSVAKMKSIQIQLPEEKIQVEILEKLEVVEAEIGRVKLTQDRIKENYIALRLSLLSSAFTQADAVA